MSLLANVERISQSEHLHVVNYAVRKLSAVILHYYNNSLFFVLMIALDFTSSEFFLLHAVLRGIVEFAQYIGCGDATGTVPHLNPIAVSLIWPYLFKLYLHHHF